MPFDTRASLVKSGRVRCALTTPDRSRRRKVWVVRPMSLPNFRGGYALSTQTNQYNIG